MQQPSIALLYTFMFFSVLQIFCPHLCLKRTPFILTRVTCSREMGVFWLNTPMKERSFWLWTNLHAFSHDASVFHEWEILLHSHWKNNYTKWLKRFFFFLKCDLRWPSRLKFELLHQMCSHLLKRQKLLVLTLMGFQLVPLVEILSTALMVTLKENEKKKSKPVHHNKPQTTYQYNKLKRQKKDLQNYCTWYCFSCFWWTRAMWFFMLVFVTKASGHPSTWHLKTRAG